ncbi:hypothetical protein O6H91_15G062100 [Diphasiastrum complanatum]|uniref:Uncharacterized protein n=1 Tax=Diphasiastrum complanatum TaxID=34168 RepID=A0ACC2BIY0_DIPCM|nr:hypothetical protein O6H91_15G062100 [Diphasiastrum complanatum]
MALLVDSVSDSVSKVRRLQKCISFEVVKFKFDEPNPNIEDLRGVFESFDENHDGMISHDELKRSLHRLGFTISDPESMSIIASLDKNGNGSVEFDEFLSIHKNLSTDQGLEREEEQEPELMEAFQVFDTNADKSISAQQLQSSVFKRTEDEGSQ